MRRILVLTLVLASSAPIGCGPRADGDSDSGVVLSDSGNQEDAGSARCGAPGEPYGTSQGSRFYPFTLPKCDGTPFEFYGEDEGYCDARLTVVTLAAGWCGPCRLEAQQMQEYLVEGYADQNVRVVVSIIQDNDYRAADSAFCEGWTDQYGLTNPVVVDAAQDTRIYFPNDELALPASVIIDSQGVIRHREYGVSTGLSTIRAALDSLLAE